MELVMAQEWRSRMEKECMKWVDGWKDGINEMSKVMELREEWRSWRIKSGAEVKDVVVCVIKKKKKVME
jgi:hypothetical protein